MSWRDNLLKASFRGVGFEVKAHRAEASGRRIQVHEYPGADQPYSEDLGRKTSRWTIEAFVVGDDYASRRDALVDACARAGPGTLVHPYFGTRNAVCERCTVSERTSEGRMAVISLGFVDAGRNRAPAARTDTASAVSLAAEAATRSATERFREEYVL